MSQEQSKYSLISEHIAREIQDGRRKLGTFLPTESEFMRTFGVSRNTVRNAIQDLKTKGLVASRQGQGSVVLAKNPPESFVETIQSIDELIKFGQESKRYLISNSIVSANSELVEKFGCNLGRKYAQVRMLRQSIGEDSSTIAVVTLWMDVLFEQVIQELNGSRKPVAEIIQNEYGLEAKSVLQTVSANQLDLCSAELLGVPEGSPTLVIERKYCTGPGEIPYLIARSLCRADAIKVASTFYQKY